MKINKLFQKSGDISLQRIGIAMLLGAMIVKFWGSNTGFLVAFFVSGLVVIIGSLRNEGKKK